MPTVGRHMSPRRAKRNGVAVNSTASRNGYVTIQVYQHDQNPHRPAPVTPNRMQYIAHVVGTGHVCPGSAQHALTLDRRQHTSVLS